MFFSFFDARNAWRVAFRFALEGRWVVKSTLGLTSEFKDR